MLDATTERLLKGEVAPLFISRTTEHARITIATFEVAAFGWRLIVSHTKCKPLDEAAEASQ